MHGGWLSDALGLERWHWWVPESDQVGDVCYRQGNSGVACENPQSLFAR